MKSITKKITLAGLGAACALTLTLGTGMLAKGSGVAIAEESSGTNKGVTFFYDNLLDENNKEYALAKKFYEALDKMNKDGDFLDGVVDYPVTDIVTSEQLKAWIENGNLEVPRAFSAARDAYLTDHPELFYINFYKMTISVAKSGGKYIGYINSGREANLYYENGFNTPETVSTAIASFNAKVNEIVDYVNGLPADRYNARDAFLAKEVNNYLANNIEYNYVAYDNKDDPDYIAAAYINTAYGGLVEGRAVCGGYSTSYKVIMDKLNIPCITVNGYTNNKDQNGKNAASNVYHMWNYVWLETPDSSTAKTFSARDSKAGSGKGEWYSVDVTWNYSNANKYRYAVMNSYNDEQLHVADGVISSSGYRLRYPKLSVYSYGSTGETDGLHGSIEYTATDKLDDFGYPLQSMFISVSYNGKSAKRLLEEDGLYIAYRNAAYKKGQLTWTDWASLEIFRQYAVNGGVGDADQMIQDTGFETRYYDNTSVYYTQFAVFDVKPNRAIPNSFPGDPTLGHDPETESYYFFYYGNDLLDKINAVDIGDVLVNESYGTYTPPPYVQSMQQNQELLSDSMRGPDGFIAEDKAFIVEVTYNEELEVLDPTQKIEVSFIAEHPNAKNYSKFYPINDSGDFVELVQRPKNSGDPTLVTNTLRFKFAPSLMYEHNEENYHFSFTNVGSKKLIPVFGDGLDKEPTEFRPSHKLPNAAHFRVGRAVYACPAFFNYDGRLYIDCCAQPTLISNSDLSAMNFEAVDEDGNTVSTFSENERSQMMLVAETASKETVDNMLDEIINNEGINVNNEKEILKSETYDIHLQMCNKYPTISDGSYVKIALGFPEGYGPNDEDVTFKIFHRKHDPKTDTYSIEEIPCVVTQFGIVATVTSFSPYMVAAVDAEKATNKTIYASIEGKGGKLTKEDGRIIALEEGQSKTYTIQPEEGYQIYSVKLNGVDVKDRIVDGKLTLNYADVEANNELVIQYIANEAAERIQQKLTDNVIDEDVEITKHVVAVKDQPNYSKDPLPTPDDESNVPGPGGDTNNNGGQNDTGLSTTTIVITSVCIAVAFGALIAAIVVISKSKIKK